MSIARLDVLQQAVTQVGQDIRSSAKNVSNNNTKINQSIIVETGGIYYPCSEYTLGKYRCETECRTKITEPIYQCQFRFSSDLPNNITNSSTCNKVWENTYESAINDKEGVCDGTVPMKARERELACKKKALRLTCPENNELQGDTGQSCSVDSECNGGKCRKIADTNQGICQGPLGIYGTDTIESCQAGCNQGKYYMIRKYLGNSMIDGVLENKYEYTYLDGLGLINRDLGLPDCLVAGPTETCQIAIDTSQYYACNKEYLGDPGFVGEAECLKQCDISWKCPDEIVGKPPIMATMVCEGGLCLENNASVTLKLDQFSDSYVDAEMTTEITNEFLSEINKTITQKNDGLNFQQFNTSDELTEVLQSVKNSIGQAIKSQSENVSYSGTDVTQTINFKNKGYVKVSTNGCSQPNMDCVIQGTNCGDCGEKPTDSSSLEEWNRCVSKYVEGLAADISKNKDCAKGYGTSCACTFTNNSLLDYDLKQKAQSTVEAVMNNTVMNKLTDKYSLTVDQTNTGLSFPWWGILIIVIIIGIVIVASAYFGSKLLDWKLVLVVAVIVLVAMIITGGIFINKQKSTEDEENQIETDVQTGCYGTGNSNCQGTINPETAEVEQCVPSEFEKECNSKSPTSVPDSPDSSLGTGEIVAISVGTTLAAVVIAIVVWWFLTKRKKK